MPPQAEALAKAHHCQLVADYAASPEALKNPPFDMLYGSDGSTKTVATWCTQDGQKASPPRFYTLLVSTEDSSNPLNSCKGEIRNLKHIGGLSFRNTQLPSSSFFLLDTRKPADAHNSLAPVRFGIVVIHDDRQDFYACIGGKWAGLSQDGNPPDQ
jgi:hypothetical protein